MNLREMRLHSNASRRTIMLKHRLIGIAAGAIGLSLPGLALAAEQPSVGYYATSGFQYSATPAKVCEAVGQPPAGSSYSGIFYYPGPDKTGATFRTVNNSSKYEFVILELFPKMPAAGVTTLSGTITESAEGSSTYKLPFKATFTYLDASSFEATLVTTTPLSATETCTVTDHLIFLKTSP